MAAGETTSPGPVVVSERVIGPGEPDAPGYAVVGGPEAAPGYAVVNGGMPAADPTPIGVARGGLNARSTPHGRGDGAPRRRVLRPSVKLTSVPPPPTAHDRPGPQPPDVIRRVPGLPNLGKHHQERAEKRREHHAAEPTAPPTRRSPTCRPRWSMAGNEPAPSS